MPKKAAEEPKPLSFATPNPWSALPRDVYVGKGRGKKEGATTESPVDGQDQPKIYTIRDDTLEVLMHLDVVIEIKSPRKCFPLSLIVVDAKADLQTKASNGHGQGLSQKLIGFEPVSPLRASSANKHG